jgi:hypothetical protein
MDAWEEQIKSPNPMTASPAAMMDKLKSWPGFQAGSSPSAHVSGAGAMDPFHPSSTVRFTK